MLTATVLWGILLPARLFPQQRPAWILDLHRWMGGLTIGFIAIHMAALVADNYLHFGAAELLVPGRSEYEPWAVGLGVMAMWLLVVVELTSLAKKRLSRRVWHGIHLFSYATFLLTSLHGTLAGTEADNPLYLSTTVAAVAAVVFSSVFRVTTRRIRTPRPAASARRSGSAAASG